MKDSEVDRTETCPDCHREVDPDEEWRYSRGKDFGASPPNAKPDGPAPKSRRGLGPLGHLISVSLAVLLIYLEDFLPDRARCWYDWFFGIEQDRVLFFSPCKILVLSVVAYILLQRVWGYLTRREKDSDS